MWSMCDLLLPQNLVYADVVVEGIYVRVCLCSSFVSGRSMWFALVYKSTFQSPSSIMFVLAGSCISALSIVSIACIHSRLSACALGR